MSQSILIYSIDPRILRNVRDAAAPFDLAVAYYCEGRSLLERLTVNDKPAMLVLDFGIDGEKAVSICNAARKLCSSAILALIDPSDLEAPGVAIHAGAHCTIPRSASSWVLELQMRAILSRWPGYVHVAEKVVVRDLVVNMVTKEVFVMGKQVPVTAAEFRLLEHLARNLGRPIPAVALVKEMVGYSCTQEDAQNIVKVHVCRLRDKLDRDPSQPSYIASIRGFGYLLERRTVPVNGASNRDRDESSTKLLVAV